MIVSLGSEKKTAILEKNLIQLLGCKALQGLDNGGIRIAFLLSFLSTEFYFLSFILN